VHGIAEKSFQGHRSKVKGTARPNAVEEYISMVRRRRSLVLD